MSVMKQIEEREELLKRTQERLDEVLKKIKENLNPEERSHYESVINSLKDDLLQTEKDLKHLRKENRKAFIFGLAIFVLAVLVLLYSRF